MCLTDMNLYIYTRRPVCKRVVYVARLLLTETYHMTKTTPYKTERISSDMISGSVIWRNIKYFMTDTNLKRCAAKKKV